MNNETSWSLGVLVGLPIVLLVLALAVFIAVKAWQCFSKAEKDSYSDDRFGWGILGSLSTLTAVIMVVVLGLGFYPHKAEYHQWAPVSGEVTKVDSRIQSSGESVDQRFVVAIDGVGLRSCDDARCANIEAGDFIHLSCKRSWQFTGTDGYGCNFVSNEKKR